MSDRPLIPDRDVCCVKTVLGDSYKLLLPFHAVATAVGSARVLSAAVVREAREYVPPPEIPGYRGTGYFRSLGGWWATDGRVALAGTHIVAVERLHTYDARSTA